eukprot:COSAG04_NODE_11110_length_729_cov_1.028526_2_plen_74_part_00
MDMSFSHAPELRGTWPRSTHSSSSGSLAATSAHAPPTEKGLVMGVVTPSSAQGLGRQRCGSSGGRGSRRIESD